MKNSEILNNFDESVSDDGINFGYIEDEFSTGSNFIDTSFSVMPILLGLFVVVFVAAVIFIVYIQTRNYRKIKSAGMDPITFESDLKTKLAQSSLLAPKQTLEAKLEELSGLRSRGMITAEEYAQARQDLLRDWREG